MRQIALSTLRRAGAAALLLFAALDAGKIDAVVQDYPINAYRATQKDNVALSQKIPTGEQYGIAVKKGNAKVLELLGVKTEAKVEVAPAPAGHRIADERIPRGPQNGLILEHGRPGWWTADEALVVSNGFANRKAILVEFEGRQLICRVKDARNFVPRMLIPVRRYGEVVLAARQPRFPGKW